MAKQLVISGSEAEARINAALMHDEETETAVYAGSNEMVVIEIEGKLIKLSVDKAEDLVEKLEWALDVVAGDDEDDED
jgi:hypothetical protein